VGRYSFTVRNFHSLHLAGLDRRTDTQMDTGYAVLRTYGADLAIASCRDAEVPSVPGFGGDERLADGPLRARKGRKRRGDG